MKEALVTGGAGFIGSNLVDRLLVSGYKVTCIDCFTDYYERELKEKNIENALKNKKFTLIEEDILNIEEYPLVDYVFHLAAQAGVRASWGENFGTYTRNNILATQKLLEYYKEHEIKKFVYASSSSVYGDTKLPMREKSLLRPISPYGVTKLAAENLCYLYYKNYNVPTISLRYFTVYGPRQRPDMAINKFTRAIMEGKEFKVYGDGKQTRDFTFVDDVVDATILAAKTEVIGEVFNVGGGSRISVRELIKKIGDTTGKKAVVEYIETQKGDVKDTLADKKRAKMILDWAPEVSIDEGLRRYLEWRLTRSMK